MVAENSTPEAPPAQETSDGVSTAATPSGYINRDELLSLRVVVGGRHIFLALCENYRGRYLKISDRRSKLIVPGPGIPELRSAIDSLHAVIVDRPADALPPPLVANGSNSDSRRIQEPIASERFISEGRKFYLDLLANERGTYVKMSQTTQRRVTMTFPASTIEHLRDAMTQLDELAPPDPAVLNPNPTGHTTRTIERHITTANGSTVTVKAVQRELRAENKRVVFESGANRRGSYLRITESSGANKMLVTLPHSLIPHIMNLLKEVHEAGDPVDGLRAAEAEGQSVPAEQ